MKKSIICFLLLSACHSPVPENTKLNAFRSCRSTYGVGTREFESCMKEQGDRERQHGIQEKKELMYLQGGRDVVRDKKAEIELNKAPCKNQLIIPNWSK